MTTKRFTKFIHRFDAILVWSLMIVCSWAICIGAVLLVISLVGCSAKMDDAVGTTLNPLPIVVKDPEAMFLELVLLANPKAHELMNDTELINQGLQYCEAAQIGMSHSGMHNNINEAAYTQEQQELEHIILHQALTWLCPEYEYKVNP